MSVDTCYCNDSRGLAEVDTVVPVDEGECNAGIVAVAGICAAILGCRLNLSTSNAHELCACDSSIAVDGVVSAVRVREFVLWKFALNDGWILDWLSTI